MTANCLICSWKAITNNEDDNESKQEQPEEEGMSDLKKKSMPTHLERILPILHANITQEWLKHGR